MRGELQLPIQNPMGVVTTFKHNQTKDKKLKYRKSLTYNYGGWNGLRTLHTSTPKINKIPFIFYLRNDNRMTLELPCSFQPWPRTVPGSKSDPPKMAPTCTRSRTRKGEDVVVWKSGSVFLKMLVGKFSPIPFKKLIMRSPNPSLGFVLIDNLWKKGTWFNFS